MACKEMSFTDEIATAFPEWNPLPEVLWQALEFMEERGCARKRRDGARYMTLYAKPEHSDLSSWN